MTDRGARGGTDVSEEQGGADMRGELSQVVVVPGRSDIAEDRRRSVAVRAIPADVETVAVRRLDAHPRVEALVDQ